MPTQARKLNFTLIILACLSLLAFALRLHNINAHSLWYDELLQLDIAQGSLASIGPKLVRHAAMPLDYYILHGWLQLGRQDGWVRLPALLFGVLSVPLIYVLAARLFNKRVGVLAAILLMVASFAVSYSQEARPYAALTFWIMLAWFGLWQAYQTGRFGYWAVVIVGLVAAALSHYFALFMLLPVGLFVAVQLGRHLGQRTQWIHASFFGLLLFVLLVTFGLNGRLGHLYSVGERFAREVDQPQLYTIPAEEKPNRGNGPPVEANFFAEKIFQPLATSEPWTLAFYGALMVVAVITAFWRKPARMAIFLLLCWLVLPTLFIYLFLLHRGTFYAVRYILFTLPAFLILVACGIDTLARGVDKISVRWNIKLLQQPGIVIALLCLPLILSELNEIQTQYTAEPREDWRAVAQLLHNHAGPNDAVIAVKAEPVINWYFPQSAAPNGTYSNSGAIWQAMREHPRRWFVLSSYSFKQDQGLRNWLQEQQAVTIAIDKRVMVYYHQEGRSGAEMLAEVKKFSLPQKAVTYRMLADQLKQRGDVQTSQSFYQRAAELDGAEVLKAFPNREENLGANGDSARRGLKWRFGYFSDKIRVTSAVSQFNPPLWQ